MPNEAKLIEQRSAERGPHYEPFGWHQWPEHPWMSYQFRRGLGETQEGGGAVSECFQAASRMVPGDAESWHAEWLRVAARNDVRGDEAERAGHIRTAMNCWQRAADYYRQAEFWLAHDDPRRQKPARPGPGRVETGRKRDRSARARLSSASLPTRNPGAARRFA